MNQRTINKAFKVEGKGLHTGRWVHACFQPAPPDHGVRFCRTDLAGQPTYEASARYVTGTNRGTVLENGAWTVSTVEHALSALYAMGITNCLIALDGPEMPILDGSAKPFVEAIEQVGMVEQEREAKTWVVTEPFAYEDGKGSVMRITPADDYEVEVVIDFHSPVLGRQTAELKDLTTYPSQIAEARTFCFMREIRPLLALGLIKGGDLQNALVIYDKHMWQWKMNRLSRKFGQPYRDASKLGYMSPLHFENEPARHKLLDVMGDLSLIGCRIQGHIYVERPGHGFNTTCAKMLLEERNKKI